MVVAQRAYYTSPVLLEKMYYALTLPLLLFATTAASISTKTGNLGDAKVHTDNPTGKQ